MQKEDSLWHKLTQGSVNRRILGAAFTVGIFTAMVKLASLGKELVVARRFGTGDELDAFLIALVIPIFVINVVAGSLNSALIPTYIQVREQEGIKAAQRLFSGATLGTLSLLIPMLLVMVLSAPWYLKAIAAGFSPAKLQFTYQLLVIIAPVVLLSGINTVWGAVLNAGEKFALAAVAPILIPALSVALLCGFPQLGIFALAWGFVGGTLLKLVLLGIGLQQQQLSLKLRWYGFDPHLRQVASQYAPALAGALLIGSTTPIDQSMAAMLSAGSVAALNYSNRLIASPISLLSIALGTAVIPYFSKMIAAEDWQGTQATLKRYLGLIFATTVPLAMVMAIFAKPIVQLLFERGSFTAEDTQIVASIQAFYALQIPFYLANILSVKLINSLRQNQILFWLSACNLLINVGLNFMFMKWLGLKGIALSTSCVYIFSFAFTWLFVQKKLTEIIT